MKEFQFILSIAIVSILLSGCSLDNQKVNPPKKNNKISKVFRADRILPYDDVVNMGQYAEAWIAPYKDNKGNLFNERKMNFWVINPSFVIGEELPNKKKSSDKTKEDLIFNEDAKVRNNSDIELDNKIIEYLKKSK
jgi:hypothetical protein